MRLEIQKLFFIGIFSLLFNCNNYAQNENSYDLIPLDTTKWSLTETFMTDFNKDGIKDIILIFDKYKEATRPENIQAPILFYLGTSDSKYKFLNKAEHIIISPYYEVEIVDKTFNIKQEGIGQDNKLYKNFYKYHKGNIVMFMELVLQKIEKLEVNEETGDVNTVLVRTDTLHHELKEIIVDQYSLTKSLKDK